MYLLLLSFFAGVLTVLSPCVFTLLPIILGSSLHLKHLKRSFIVIISLAISVFFFTLLLKSTTLLINLPDSFWGIISGNILILLGIFTIFPRIWGKINFKIQLSTRSDQLLNNSNKKKGILKEILIGSALGPVFSSCSPTYAFIVATVISQNVLQGILCLILYILGLSLILFLISIFGQKLILKLKWSTNPNGILQKIAGIVFIVIGILIMFGIDKQIQSNALQNDAFLNITKFEINLLRSN